MTTLRNSTVALFRGLRLSSRPHLAPTRLAAFGRAYSTEQEPTEQEPPTLIKMLKTDLKTAMLEKDKDRLSAIRGVLTVVNTRAKSEKPITRDEQLVGLMQMQIRSMRDASAEFQAAGREDLVQKEEAGIKHLSDYIAASGIEHIAGDELKAVVKPVVQDAWAKQEKMGYVMKALVHTGGVLTGKSVDKAELSEMVANLFKEERDRESQEKRS